MKDLQKLATDTYNKHFDKYIDNPDKNRDFLIDAMLSFHEQASKDMFREQLIDFLLWLEEEPNRNEIEKIINHYIDFQDSIDKLT